jgi:hypothetical protein
VTALPAVRAAPSPGALELAAIAALDEAGVRWAVLRDDPRAQRDGDIDLLVAPGDVDRIDAPLAAAGFARLRTWRHGSHRFFFAYDQPGRAWVKLDIVSRLEFRSGARLPRSVVDAVLARAIRADGVMRLAPRGRVLGTAASLSPRPGRRRSAPPRPAARAGRVRPGRTDSERPGGTAHGGARDRARSRRRPGTAA